MSSNAEIAAYCTTDLMQASGTTIALQAGASPLSNPTPYNSGLFPITNLQNARLGNPYLLTPVASGTLAYYADFLITLTGGAQFAGFDFLSMLWTNGCYEAQAFYRLASEDGFAVGPPLNLLPTAGTDTHWLHFGTYNSNGFPSQINHPDIWPHMTLNFNGAGSNLTATGTHYIWLRMRVPNNTAIMYFGRLWIGLWTVFTATRDPGRGPQTSIRRIYDRPNSVHVTEGQEKWVYLKPAQVRFEGKVNDANQPQMLEWLYLWDDVGENYVPYLFTPDKTGSVTTITEVFYGRFDMKSFQTDELSLMRNNTPAEAYMNFAISMQTEPLGQLFL